ncbi:MAG: glycoside:cation symporter [Lachnospiraceae bacterium]|jgi:Na+/melibiose symporter and related transporters|uniref:MFS transporter n=1 Tax=Roseburia sp. 1XD42-69 TaxID=2320088 RepID=UPI000EA01C0F|nr:MFS transporter [Roseburia sp. 1XD42-69]MCI8875755.1 glycoside:cation symporter [Lachnospiraceae bacterium]MCX4318940.1 MFS transporter [Lachnospiraceae bacterium]RKJ63775.1 glycoside:cation symporter [Roseburia sp. 1XD42-69]
METKRKVQQGYNNAKYWQICFFSLNNAATNLYLALMGYVSYYANSIAGFSVVLVSCILTGMNVFDAITDPVVGFMLDRSKGRFGKFRPFMLLGNLIMAVSAVFLHFMTHEINRYMRIPFFVAAYGLFVLGYTFQTVVAKSGQAILTNNPKQRPVSTYFDSLFVMAAFGGTAVFVANYLVPKYGGFTNEALFKEYVVWVVLCSLVCTVLAMIGIASKDKVSLLKKQSSIQKVQIRDYWDIIRHNKPIRILILAACMNKFASTVYAHTTVGVMVFGILMNNYAIAGLIGIVTAVPTMFVISAGIRVAQSMGQKRSLMLFTALGIFFQVVMTGVLMQENINAVSFNPRHINGITIGFVLVYILLNGCKSITNNMVVPMIADCSDYERYRSGRFVPGLMGALFSFVDKVFAALGTAFVGLVMLVMGYNRRFPQIGDELTGELKGTTLFLYCGLPIICWLLSLFFMKFYELDKRKMFEVSKKLRREK